MHHRKLFLFFDISILIYSIIDVTLAKNWAVLSVGLDYYPFSYPFEATAFHTRNVLIDCGVAPENIIFIGSNTAAYHPNNPMRGTIVYAGERKNVSDQKEVLDYNANNLTVEQFFQILMGNATNMDKVGSGKVLASGPQDTIILVFINIGDYGLMTLNQEQYMYAEPLIPFLEDLSESNRFKQMLIFVDSPNGSSQFDGYLCTDCKIIALTNTAKGDDLELCHYNEDIIPRNGAKETLRDLYVGLGLISANTFMVPNFYGDLTVMDVRIKEFLNPEMENSQPLTSAEILLFRKEIRNQTKSKDMGIMKLLEYAVPKKERDRVENYVNKIVSESINHTEILESVVYEKQMENLPMCKFDCYRKALKTMRSKCLNKQSQFLLLRHGWIFSNLCILDVSLEKIMAAISGTC